MSITVNNSTPLHIDLYKDISGTKGARADHQGVSVLIPFDVVCLNCQSNSNVFFIGFSVSDLHISTNLITQLYFQLIPNKLEHAQRNWALFFISL